MKIPVKILRLWEIEIWKANRRQVVVDYFKRDKLDGIRRFREINYTARACGGELGWTYELKPL